MRRHHSCCIPGCINKTYSKPKCSSLHSFPCDKTRRLQWIRRIRIYHTSFTFMNSFKICGLHFEDKFLNEGNLMFDGSTYKPQLVRATGDAIPTLFTKNEMRKKGKKLDDVHEGAGSTVNVKVKNSGKVEQAQVDDIKVAGDVPDNRAYINGVRRGREFTQYLPEFTASPKDFIMNLGDNVPCRVPGCPVVSAVATKQGGVYKVFPFPTNPDILQRWIDKIDRTLKPEQIDTSFGVCQLHFDSRFILRGLTVNEDAPMDAKWLSPNAVPSISCNLIGSLRNKNRDRPRQPAVKQSKNMATKTYSLKMNKVYMEYSNVSPPGYSVVEQVSAAGDRVLKRKTILITNGVVANQWEMLKNLGGFESDEAYMSYLLASDEYNRSERGRSNEGTGDCSDEDYSSLIEPEGEAHKIDEQLLEDIDLTINEVVLGYQTADEPDRSLEDIVLDSGSKDKPVLTTVQLNADCQNMEATRLVEGLPTDIALNCDPANGIKKNVVGILMVDANGGMHFAKKKQKYEMDREKRARIEAVIDEYERKKAIMLRKSKINGKALKTSVVSAGQSVGKKERHEAVKNGRVCKVPKDEMIKWRFCRLCYKNIGIGGMTPHFQDDHPGQKPFQCPKCLNLYNKYKSLKIHMSTVCNPVNCSLCELTFTNRFLWRKHWIERHSFVCKSILADQGGITIHDGTCNICKTRFSLARLRRHFKAKHGGDPKRPFNCSQCDKTFNRYEFLVYHARARTRPCVCLKCGETFGSNCLFRQHEVAANCVQKRKLTCKPLRITDRPIPIRIVGTYPCKICGVVFGGIALQEHFRVEHPHTKVNPFDCEICNLPFNKHTPFSIHMKNHIDPNRNKCDICDIRFTTRSNLREHNFTNHLLEKFPCEVCGKEFRSRTRLSNHKHDYHRESTYICPRCGKAFRTSNRLRQHKLSYHVEKYRCHICDKVLRASKSLRHHINVIHLKLERPGSGICDVCGAAYHNRTGFRKHMEKEHNMEPENV